MLRPLLASILLLAPLAMAGPADDETYVFALGGSLLVDVRYHDGIASTKFGFMQLAGEGGGPTQRLEAGALCTEWIGTFTQVLVEATDDDNVASASVRIVGPLAATHDGIREEAGFTLDAIGNAGAFEGSLLVCDNAAGEGQVRLSVSVARTPIATANPALVRITEA